MAIGCYPVQAALIAFNHEEPEAIVAAGHARDFQGELTDSTASITLLYSNNRMAVLNCLGEDIESIHSLAIHGTQGSPIRSTRHSVHSFVSGIVRLPTHFWCPTHIVLPDGQTIDRPLPETAKKTNYEHSAGLRYQAIACREQIIKGETEHPFMTLENSLQVARIIESARRQVLSGQHATK